MERVPTNRIRQQINIRKRYLKVEKATTIRQWKISIKTYVKLQGTFQQTE